ncbi:inorganic phosphate transporter [Candidatus Peregrinibacteria bacterium]|jgi:inorganic phosphate transporter, PiT family|nr:inorganic phosphate transporter [Candidatus Peregrinibacteria bacterium]MBT7702666.1 inorganic phosphate transporter [Candidatus Peregrinibacteria bacterium]
MFAEILLILSGLYLAWSLGANDAGNIISTAVGSRTISYKKAIWVFVVCLGIGAIFFSEEVIKTVSSGIVPKEVIGMNQATIALFVAAGWVHFATWKRWPVSISQSVVSAVLGVGIVESLRIGANLIFWEKVMVLAGIWLFSPVIGFLVGWILFKVVHGFVRHRHLYFKDTLHDLFTDPIETVGEIVSGDLRRREKVFKAILLFSAGYMALALGASTVAATTGLLWSGFGEAEFSFDLLGVLEIGVLGAVILGIVTFGKKLVDFMGSRLVKLNALRGGIIQFATASVILGCALMGYPVSSTGVFVGSFLGVDSGEDHPRMKKHAIKSLLVAFLVTIPVVAGASGLISWLIG